jgi:hypothetical protein
MKLSSETAEFYEKKNAFLILPQIRAQGGAFIEQRHVLGHSPRQAAKPILPLFTGNGLSSKRSLPLLLSV